MLIRSLHGRSTCTPPPKKALVICVTRNVQISRLDNFYCWEVERVDWVSVDSVTGCPLRGLQPEFVLSYKTLPANVEIRIVPGLGVTGYKYVHHGTIDEVETRLIHFYPGISKPNGKSSHGQD